MNIWKSTNIIIGSFSFYGPCNLGREHSRQKKKLLESVVLNCCVKVTMSELRKVGLKIRE